MRKATYPNSRPIGGIDELHVFEQPIETEDLFEEKDVFGDLPDLSKVIPFLWRPADDDKGGGGLPAPLAELAAVPALVAELVPAPEAVPELVYEMVHAFETVTVPELVVEVSVEPVYEAIRALKKAFAKMPAMVPELALSLTTAGAFEAIAAL